MLWSSGHDLPSEADTKRLGCALGRARGTCRFRHERLGLSSVGGATSWAWPAGPGNPACSGRGRAKESGRALPRSVACGTSERRRLATGARFSARGSSHATSHSKDAEGAARQPEPHDEPAVGPSPLLPVTLRPRHLLVPAQRLQYLEETLCAAQGWRGAGGRGDRGPFRAPGAPGSSTPASAAAAAAPARPGSPQGAPLSPALARRPSLHPL